MWSKGAVVIVKHGDLAMADAIEKGVGSVQFVSPGLSHKDDDIRSRYGVMKKRDSETWRREIERAEQTYGHNWVPPKWAEKIVGFFALIIYWITMFIDKYLRIKE